MRILSLFFRDEKGGFTKRLYRLYETLSLEGDEIHFLGSETIPVTNPGVVQHVSKICKGNGKGFLFWGCLVIVFFLRSFVIAWKQMVDRVVTFGPFYTALCAPAILLLKIPAVTFIRGDNMLHSSNRLRNGFFFIVDWFGIRISWRIAFVSASLRDTYVDRYRIESKRTMVIPNDIESEYILPPGKRAEIRHSLGVGNEDFLISASGPFNEGKNFPFLIQAIKVLETRKVKLILIGDEIKPTGERLRLERMVEALDIKSLVIFAGWQSDPRPLIASSDLFAFPSKHEGSPNALLEALGCGIPCMGSKIKEIEEILLYHDLLFPINEVQVFTRRVINLLENQSEYEYLRSLSQARCKEFSFDWGARVASFIHSAPGGPKE